MAKANSNPQTNTPTEICSVALYARVSTTRDQNPEMQLAELREYASRRGWTVTAEYADHGVSGSKDTRPQLNKLMAAAKTKTTTPTTTIQVVDSQPGSRPYSFTMPGTNAYSNTPCYTNGSASNYGGSTTYGSATTDCNTTTTPGRPPQTYYGSIPQMDVHAIMPNGMHVTLWCQAGFRHCANLMPGNYLAEVKGNSVFMHISDLAGTGDRKIKYHFVGTW